MIEIYCDGACRGNGDEENLGANGYLVISNGSLIHHYTEANRNTTNNREELLAGINALKWLKLKNLKFISIHSDSQYLVKGINEWSKKWKRNDWKKGKNSKNDIKNLDLWLMLDFLNTEVKAKFQWVKGHSNDKTDWNNQIDRLINEDMDLG